MITKRIEQDGIWGFTGSDTPPPPPSTLPEAMGALSEWGMTIDKLLISPTPSPEEAKHIVEVGKEVHDFVRRRWNEDVWETAWFVNPPVSDRSITAWDLWFTLCYQRLQSVPGLAHIHVFARKK
jgi:hypothetical protein